MFMPPDPEGLFQQLARSKFRSRFSLGEGDRAYLVSKGLPLAEEEIEYGIDVIRAWLDRERGAD